MTEVTKTLVVIILLGRSQLQDQMIVDTSMAHPEIGTPMLEHLGGEIGVQALTPDLVNALGA